MRKAIDASAGKLTRNPAAYAIIDKEVIDPLNARIKKDAEFGKRCRAALVANGYLPS
jgi:hypothetical protein